MTADEEDNYHVAQANEPLDEEGHFVHKNVSGRFREETQEYERHMFDYMDVSPRMVFSVATALIPFLQNDDANRALMGSNMQRQAVPLLTTEAPVVGTGMEVKTAVDSGVCVVAKKSGTVLRSTSTDISIKNDDGTKDDYHLTKYLRSNQSNCYNQKPIVFQGEHVEAGQVIADGPSTANGELALGKNPLIGFMTWEGYTTRMRYSSVKDLLWTMFIHLFILKNMNAKPVIPNWDRKRSHVMFRVWATMH